MKNKIFKSIFIIAMLSNLKVNAQADVLNHARTNTQYLGWNSWTTTDYGPLDIRNDINNSGTTYDIDFYIDNNKFVQVLTTGDLNIINAGGTGVHTNSYQIGGIPVLWHNDDPTSIFVGVAAGAASPPSPASPLNNTLVGNNAGKDLNTTLPGLNNTAVGTKALFKGDNVSNNVAIGNEALYSMTVPYNDGMGGGDESENTAVGVGALHENIAYGACALGWHAGYMNTTGCSLIAIGEEAAVGSYIGGGSHGNKNIAIGEQAMHSNDEVSGNIALGFEALDKLTYSSPPCTTGCVNTFNVALGQGALHEIFVSSDVSLDPQDGAYNTAAGSYAGASSHDGLNLSFLGYKADVCLACSTASIHNSTAIGANCVVNASNKLVLGGNSANGNNDVKVGIGLSNDNVYNGPRNKLEINADPAAMNFTGVGGSGLMFRQLNSSSTPIANAAAGVLSVDALGTVVLVNEVVGYGLCANPVRLTGDVGMTLNDYKIYYKGQGNTGHNDDMNNAIGLGYVCGDLLPGKLSVDQTYATSEDYATTAGYFHNGDKSHSISNSFNKTGIRALADGEHTGHGVKSWNIGGDFYADNCDDHSIAVRGTAGVSSSVPPGITYGGVFEGDHGSNSSYGITAGANAYGGSWAYGIDAQGNGATSANIGVKASTAGVLGAINYGLYAYAPIGTCNTTTCIDAAGFFNGDVGCSGTGYYLVSDANLKDNIASLNNAMTIINQLSPKTYTFKTQQNPNISLPTGTQSGLLAQDVESILPALVKNFKILPRTDSLGNTDTTGTGSSFKAISYMGIIPYLIEGMKEQQHTIDSLGETMSAMQSQLDNCCNAGSRGSNPGYDEGNTSGIDVELHNIRQIVLNQNFPNPFAEHTTITYIIPSDVKNAQIFFYDNNGTILKTVDITERGEGQINVYAPDLSSGTYKYTLITDGRVFDSKQMVKQN